MLQYRERQYQSKQWKNRIRSIYSLVDKLESSLLQSQILERHMVMAVHLSTLKDHNNKAHLDTLVDENKKLMSMLVGTDDIATQRIAPDTSCSTISLVHLQYKYEELVKNHNGLLKILDARLNDIRKYQKENISLKKEVTVLTAKLHNCREFLSKLRERIKDVRIRKNNKISKLRNERDTLRIVHNRLVNVLNQQCDADDNHFREQLKYISEPKTAQLVQEVLLFPTIYAQRARSHKNSTKLYKCV